MFSLKDVKHNGTWWMSSKSDPRWNDGGPAVVGPFAVSNLVDISIRNKRKKLGNPPTDIEYGYARQGVHNDS